MKTVTGTPARLDSGEWGIRITGQNVNRDEIVTATVTTRAGKEWTGRYRVVWVGETKNRSRLALAEKAPA